MATVHIGEARVRDCRTITMAVAGTDYLAARFDIDVVTDGAVRLGDLMDAIAGKVSTSATKRVYAWPVDTIAPPCAVVGYSDEPLEFDLTMGRGSDRLTIPLYFIVDKVVTRTARDRLADILTGAAGIKNTIDGALTVEE